MLFSSGPQDPLPCLFLDVKVHQHTELELMGCSESSGSFRHKLIVSYSLNSGVLEHGKEHSHKQMSDFTCERHLCILAAWSKQKIFHFRSVAWKCCRSMNSHLPWLILSDDVEQWQTCCLVLDTCLRSYRKWEVSTTHATAGALWDMVSFSRSSGTHSWSQQEEWELHPARTITRCGRRCIFLKGDLFWGPNQMSMTHFCLKYQKDHLFAGINVLSRFLAPQLDSTPLLHGVCIF